MKLLSDSMLLNSRNCNRLNLLQRAGLVKNCVEKLTPFFTLKTIFRRLPQFVEQKNPQLQASEALA
jgi:hypothetical protein